jgi:hypothetical protein
MISPRPPAPNIGTRQMSRSHSRVARREQRILAGFDGGRGNTRESAKAGQPMNVKRLDSAVLVREQERDHAVVVIVNVQLSDDPHRRSPSPWAADGPDRSLTPIQAISSIDHKKV